MFYSRSTKGFYTKDIHGDNIPEDACAISDEKYASLITGQANGKVISQDSKGNPVLADPIMSDDEMLLAYTAAVQSRLDKFAKERGYAGIMSACSYSNSTIPKFAKEGKTASTLRDTTWQKCSSILDDAKKKGGKPPAIAEVISQLPPLVWGV